MVAPIVLLTIKEKVNNPSTDDPFEPDIAAVSPIIVCRDRSVNMVVKYFLGAEER